MLLAFKSIVRRQMSPTGRYFEQSDQMKQPQLVLDFGDSGFGIYRNPEPWADSWIGFSNAAIYSVDSGQVTRLRLSEIINYESPASKSGVEGLWCELHQGLIFCARAVHSVLDDNIKMHLFDEHYFDSGKAKLCSS